MKFKADVYVYSSPDSVWKIFTDTKTWIKWWGAELKSVEPGWQVDGMMIWALGPHSKICQFDQGQCLKLTNSSNTITTFEFIKQGKMTRFVYSEDYSNATVSVSDPDRRQKECERVALDFRRCVKENASEPYSYLSDTSFPEQDRSFLLILEGALMTGLGLFALLVSKGNIGALVLGTLFLVIGIPCLGLYFVKWRVNTSWAPNLSDQSRLIKIAKGHSLRSVRAKAAEKITDQKVLLDLFKSTKYGIVSESILRNPNFNDQKEIIDTARNSTSNWLRLVATERLTDPSLVNSIIADILSKDQNIVKLYNDSQNSVHQNILEWELLLAALAKAKTTPDMERIVQAIVQIGDKNAAPRIVAFIIQSYETAYKAAEQLDEASNNPQALLLDRLRGQSNITTVGYKPESVHSPLQKLKEEKSDNFARGHKALDALIGLKATKEIQAVLDNPAHKRYWGNFSSALKRIQETP
jgi:hypothetical protein